MKVDKKNSREVGAVSEKSVKEQSSSGHRAAHNPQNRQANSHHLGTAPLLPSSASIKKLGGQPQYYRGEENGDNQSQSNSNLSRPRNSDSFILVDRVVQLHERLKNIHHFYKTRIEEEKSRTAQRNEVFMGIVEEMQRGHHEKIAALRKLIEEAEGDKKDVGLVDERMNEIKGSIDEILKQSSDLKVGNERLEREINEKEHVLREKEEELSKIKEELMEARNELEGFERLNLRENKRNKEIVTMIDKAADSSTR